MLFQRPFLQPFTGVKFTKINSLIIETKAKNTNKYHTSDLFHSYHAKFCLEINHFIPHILIFKISTDKRVMYKNKFDKCSAVSEMGSHLATIDMGQKLGGSPFWGELCPYLTQCGLGQGLPSYQVAS